MRALTMMLVLTLVACSTEFKTQGQDSDADTGTDTPADMGVDPGTDTGTDLGTPDSEPPDASPDPVDDPADDVMPDVLVEPGTDSTTCSSLTSPLGGVCNIVEQCGCTGSQFCEYTVETTSCTAWEVCMDGSRGTLAIGDACDQSDDRCSPGHICVYGSAGPICWRWCEEDGDCPSGYSCGSGLTVEPCTTPPFMHGICMPG